MIAYDKTSSIVTTFDSITFKKIAHISYYANKSTILIYDTSFSYTHQSHKNMHNYFFKIRVKNI